MSRRLRAAGREMKGGVERAVVRRDGGIGVAIGVEAICLRFGCGDGTDPGVEGATSALCVGSVRGVAILCCSMSCLGELAMGVECRSYEEMLKLLSYTQSHLLTWHTAFLHVASMHACEWTNPGMLIYPTPQIRGHLE